MKKYLYIAFAAAALTSCSSDEAIEMVEKRAIGFDNVFVNNATRATDLNKDNITEFGVYASVSANNTQGMILSNERVYKPEGKTAFGYDNTQYWIAKAQYDFTAIAPYQTGTNATWSYSTIDAKNGTVEFDNETAQADQDLLFAYIQPEETGYEITSQPEAVAFNFSHILSRVHFTFVNTISAASNIKLVVSDVKITDAYKKGTIAVAEGAISADYWTVSETNNSFNIAFANKGNEINGDNGTEITDHHYMIPANKEYNVSFKVKLLQAGANLGTYERNTTVNLDLKKGMSYNVKAYLSTDNVLPNALYPIVFKINEVDEWANYKDVEANDSYNQPASN